MKSKMAAAQNQQNKPLQTLNVNIFGLADLKTAKTSYKYSTANSLIISKINTLNWRIRGLYY